MLFNEPVEKQTVVEEIKSAPRTESVKVVEMGNVSTETKGFVRGLELGYTPKS